jgi:hypothetical protein
MYTVEMEGKTQCHGSEPFPKTLIELFCALDDQVM